MTQIIFNVIFLFSEYTNYIMNLLQQKTKRRKGEKKEAIAQ